MKLNIERGEGLDEIFHALSHPHRRELLARMARHGETTVGDLAEGFEVSLNQVSKHLKTLERAGLLRRRRVGREHRCSLDPVPLARAQSWLERYRGFWEDALDGLARYLDERHPASSPIPTDPPTDVPTDEEDRR